MEKTVRLAALGWVLSTVMLGEASGEFRGYSCADVLAASEVSGMSAETAIADAWAALVSDELTHSPNADSLLEALGSSGIGMQAFLVPGAESGSSFAEALAHLGRVVEDLAAAESVDRVGLGGLIAERAQSLIGDDQIRRRSGEEGRRRRGRMVDPMSKIPLGARLLGTPLLLADGRIAVAAEEELVLLDPSGLVLSRTGISSSISRGVFPAPGGEMAAVTTDGLVHWFAASGKEVATVATALGGSINIVPLRDGRFALSSYESAVLVVSRDGTVRKVATKKDEAYPLLQFSDGRLLLGTRSGGLLLVSVTGKRERRQIMDAEESGILSAIELRDGSLFVKSTSGGVFLFDSYGNLIFKDRIGTLGVGEPAELMDGGIALPGAGSGMIILNRDGTVRAKTGIRGELMASTVVLSNGIAVIGGEDARIHFYEADGREAGSIDVGPFNSRYDGIAGGMLEVRGADGSAFGFIGMLDGTLVRIDLEPLVGQFAFSRDFEGNGVL